MKSRVKSFLQQHPLDRYTAVGLSDLLYRTLEDPREQSSVTAEARRQAAQIAGAGTPEELVRWLRIPLSAANQRALLQRLLEAEPAVLPLVKRRVLTTVSDCFIEQVWPFLADCEEDCCDWILQQYEMVRSPYMQSILCLALGHASEPFTAGFLMEQAVRFERDCPGEQLEQGPLYGLQALMDRFSFF